MPEHHKPADIATASHSDLVTRIVSRRLPVSEEYRTYFGRSLDVARIEVAIQRANVGYMVDMTDLGSEAVSLDPHVQSCLGKRFGTIQATDWSVTPASGPGIDKAFARELAIFARQRIERIPCFGERLYDLAWAEFDGRAAHEIHWEFTAEKQPWHIRELGWVHPRRLSFDQARSLQVIDTWQPRGFVEQGVRIADHPGKFLWWQPRLFREYPEREGLNPRTLYWTFFKRFSWRHRMTLTELFAIPWRIVEVDEDANVSPEGLKEAEEAAENLGRDTTARFEKGIKLRVEWPGEESGELFGMTNEDVDKQMSKLVLGNTGTTETDQGNRAGMIVAVGEQEIITQGTGAGVSERITEQVALPMTVLNHGAQVADHCPTVEVITDAPRDRGKELDVVERVVKLQVPVPLEEIRELAGTRAPEADEAYIVGSGETAPAVPGQPAAPSFRVVDPSVDAAAAKLPEREEGGTAGEKAKADKEADKDPTTAARRKGLRDLCAARGLRLTDEAIDELAAMAEATRESVLEALLTDDRRRPLDP